MKRGNFFSIFFLANFLLRPPISPPFSSSIPIAEMKNKFPSRYHISHENVKKFHVCDGGEGKTTCGMEMEFTEFCYSKSHSSFDVRRSVLSKLNFTKTHQNSHTTNISSFFTDDAASDGVGDAFDDPLGHFSVLDQH